MSIKAVGTRLRVEGAGKRFGEVEVLKRIDLEVETGEFVVVVGRSGCGKSTLLRLIAGLEPPSEGFILLDHEPLNGIHPDTRMLFQDARLLPWKKVISNVRVGVRGGDKQRAKEALESVGLSDKANQWPKVLSGGQRQRIALARALAGNPRLLLLDEPLGALDALTRIEMQELIENLWLLQSFTAILVTHDVSEAVALADRVILIENGSIAFDIPISLARPRKRDAGFAHYEKLILDRVMNRPAGYAARSAAKSV